MIEEILNSYQIYTYFLQKVSHFYNHYLFKNPNVYEYCKVGRGINEEMIKKFSIGYAIGYEKLNIFITLNRLEHDLLFDAGVCNVKDDGYIYDRMSRRLVFPIYDLAGNVISFSGRILKEKEGVAKYKNGPDTIIFSKSLSVFGLFQSLEAIQASGYVLLVEGNIDVVMAHQYGLNCTVAPLGTSLTKEQLLLIHSFAKKIIFCFDGDMAGIKAKRRAEEMCKKLQIKDIEFLSLGGSKDIDEFLKLNGGQDIKNYLDMLV